MSALQSGLLCKHQTRPPTCPPHVLSLACMCKLTPCLLQALRSRLPPSADGIHGGRTSEQQTAAIALLLLPLLTIVLLVHRYLWREGLGPFLRCLSSRVWQAVMCPVTLGSRHALLPASRENSPQQSCTKAELQQLLDLAAAGGAHMTVPAWLTAAAAAAGVFSVLASLGAVVVLIPHQASVCPPA